MCLGDVVTVMMTTMNISILVWLPFTLTDVGWIYLSACCFSFGLL
jgi:hypothetical protein